MLSTVCPLISAAISLLLVAPWAAGAAAEESRISFRRQIAPLLQRRCATCHGEENAKGGYRLDTFARLLTPGDSELMPVVAGKAGESELRQLLIESDPHDRMPQKADPLPAEEIALIERWIDEGASFDGGSPDRPIVELARETFLQAAPGSYTRPVPITALSFSPDAKQLVVPGYYELIVWNAADASIVRRIGALPERIYSIAWHPKRNLIAIAGGSPAQWGTVALIDPACGFEARFLCDLPEVALSVSFSPDGNHLLAGAGDRTVRIFELPNGNQIQLFRHHADWIQTATFSADGKYFATGSRDRTIRVYKTSNYELETTYAGHDAPVSDLVFSGNGAAIFSTARGNSVHIWELLSGKRTGELGGFEGEVQKIGVAGTSLVSGGADGLVRVHSLSERQPLFVLRGHPDSVGAVAIAGDGTIATGSHDGEIILWETWCGTWTQRFVAAPLNGVASK